MACVTRDGLRLLVVVAQHEPADVVGHLGEDAVALFDAGQLAALDGVVEQDLDVDLVVGGVDAGGVVDGVGVDAGRRRARTRCGRAA